MRHIRLYEQFINFASHFDFNEAFSIQLSHLCQSGCGLGLEATNNIINNLY